MYFYVTGTRQSNIHECELARVNGLPHILPVFTSRELAEKAKVDSGYRLESLGRNGFNLILRKLAIPHGFTEIAIDLDPTATEHKIVTYKLEEALQSMESSTDEQITSTINDLSDDPE